MEYSPSGDSGENSELPFRKDIIMNKGISFRITHLYDYFFAIFPSHPSVKYELDTFDAAAIVFFISIGVLTRVFRIQWPNEVVFNEIVFGK